MPIEILLDYLKLARIDIQDKYIRMSIRVSVVGHTAKSDVVPVRSIDGTEVWSCTLDQSGERVALKIDRPDV